MPFIVLIGAMFLMTRSAKNKQRQASQMRESMQPGSGVRTIGGMYAVVKEVQDEAVTLEVAPGVHAIYAKNAIGAVLDDAEYNRIVHGAAPEEEVAAPDDASSLTDPVDTDETATADAGDDSVDLGKRSADDADADAQDGKQDGGSAAK
ncbi:preprotein translocase subunit YajC [Streptomyces sp. A7024]|uniref:Preprotein translocase subunit YajC n=1 Tax=Streptomyces coryli TaxID=1128680 RepID=A0A6G4UCA1_9ACTN|nr:preprotein translocase subunit YajC [Streptomyces coryli]NGN69642.1 preprotein translocase subunit YajC [Streptomyces coryli]